jgi:hypothetical protein
MELRILGPLEALAGGRRRDRGGLRQRRILAALPLSPNRALTVSRLIEADALVFDEMVERGRRDADSATLRAALAGPRSAGAGTRGRGRRTMMIDFVTGHGHVDGRPMV